jgi:hypothetical protein
MVADYGPTFALCMSSMTTVLLVSVVGKISFGWGESSSSRK